VRSFDECRWSPEGSRPHVEIPAVGQVAMLAGAYWEQITRWWTETGDPRPVTDVLRPVAAPFLHATAAWIDRLTATVPAGLLDEVAQRLTDRLARLEPLQVTVGPAIVGLYAVELYVAPTPASGRLAAEVRAAIRDVFGSAAAPEPPASRPWRPHITVCYGWQPIDTDVLASRLGYTPHPDGGLIAPVTLPVDAVLLVDQDTFGPGGLAWDQATARRIPLGLVDST
jgi:2'-5' RNA ligase superfamily